MDELIALVAQKTGLPAEKARTAVETVLNFVKDKLPSGLRGQVDNAVSGGGDALGNLASKVGGMFGKST